VRTTTYLGLILGVGVVYYAVLAKGGDYRIFTNVVALLIAVGGTFAATTLSSSRMTAVHAVSAVKRIFLSGAFGSKALAAELVGLARQGKSRGYASIDPQSVQLKDPFLMKGLQLVVDGVDPQRIEELMRLESEVLSEKRTAAERMFRLMGTYSPMFGLVGTLIGLINMLKGLTDPRAIGQGMSVALMATFYGVLLAALFFLPLAGKVRTLDSDERMQRDQIIAGLLAIRIGQNAEYVRETLEVFTGSTSEANG
jgi:chemotaxis protein MotA